MNFLSLLFILSFLGFGLLGCSSPDPKDEAVRRPEILADARYLEEDIESNFNVTASLPDPEYSADKLNPERYSQGEMSLSCSNCPKEFAIDASKGSINWKPTYNDAGAYFLNLTASSKKLSSTSTLIFVIKDKDRGVELTSKEAIGGKEGEHLSVTLPLKDPDGDDIEISCKGGCPEGVTLSRDETNAIVLNWTPDFKAGDKGEKIIDFVVKSRPAKRQVSIKGIPPSSDADSIRQTVEKEVINRDLFIEKNIPITFAIANSDRPPVVESISSKKIKETETLSVLVNAYDPDNDPITYACKTCPEGVKISSDGRLSWETGYDDAGSHAFVVDVVSNGVSEKVSSSVSFTVTVEPRNRAPYFKHKDLNISGKEGELLSFDLFGVELDKEDTVTYKCELGCDGKDIVLNPTLGSVYWVPNFDSSGIHTLRFSVDDGLERAEINVSINIAHVNRDPYFTSTPNKLKISAGLVMEFIVGFKDEDIEDQDKLSWNCIGCPSAMTITGNKMNWKPSYLDDGEYPFSLTLTDGTSTITQAVVLTVLKTDQVPVVSGVYSATVMELATLSLNLTATDGDGDAISFSCLSGCPVGLNTTEGGAITWTPSIFQQGIYIVTFGASSAPVWDLERPSITTHTITINVLNFNRPPVITNTIVGGVVFESAHTSSDYFSPKTAPFSASITASDPDGDQLAFLCDSGCPEGLSINQFSGVITFTPSYTQGSVAGTTYANIRFRITDGEFSAMSSPISITVLDVNRPPVISPVANISVFEMGHTSSDFNSPKTSPVNQKVTVTDPDGDSITITCILNCPLGLSILGDKIMMTPTYSQSGLYSGIVVRASDAQYNVSSLPFNLEVKNVNQPPVIGTIASQYEVYEEGHLDPPTSDKIVVDTPALSSILSINLGASDPDGDPLTYSCEMDGEISCPWGLSIDSSGNVSWTPSYLDNYGVNRGAKNFNASYANIKFKVSDGSKTSSYSPISIIVKNSDRRPEIADIPVLHVLENTVVTTLLSVSDPDNDLASIELYGVSLDPSSDVLNDSNWKPVGNEKYIGLDSLLSSDGRSSFVSLGKSNGLWQMSLRPSYNDAQPFNAPLYVRLRAKSKPVNFTSDEIYSYKKIEIRVINVDLKSFLASPSNASSIVDGGTSFPYYTVKEGETLSFRLNTTGGAIPKDPDSNSEFGDKLEFICVEGCVEGLTIKQECGGNKIYATGENGITSLKGNLSAINTGCEDTHGDVIWTPNYFMAKNTFYTLKFAVSSSPDKFSSDVSTYQAPLASGISVQDYSRKFDYVTIKIKVENYDRAPFLDLSQVKRNNSSITIPESGISNYTLTEPTKTTVPSIYYKKGTLDTWGSRQSSVTYSGIKIIDPDHFEHPDKNNVGYVNTETITGLSVYGCAAIDMTKSNTPANTVYEDANSTAYHLFVNAGNLSLHNFTTAENPLGSMIISGGTRAYERIWGGVPSHLSTESSCNKAGTQGSPKMEYNIAYDSVSDSYSVTISSTDFFDAIMNTEGITASRHYVFVGESVTSIVGQPYASREALGKEENGVDKTARYARPNNNQYFIASINVENNDRLPIMTYDSCLNASTSPVETCTPSVRNEELEEYTHVVSTNAKETTTQEVSSSYVVSDPDGDSVTVVSMGDSLYNSLDGSPKLNQPVGSILHTSSGSSFKINWTAPLGMRDLINRSHMNNASSSKIWIYRKYRMSSNGLDSTSTSYVPFAGATPINVRDIYKAAESPSSARLTIYVKDDDRSPSISLVSNNLCEQCRGGTCGTCAHPEEIYLAISDPDEFDMQNTTCPSLDGNSSDFEITEGAENISFTLNPRCTIKLKTASNDLVNRGTPSRAYNFNASQIITNGYMAPSFPPTSISITIHDKDTYPSLTAYSVTSSGKTECDASFSASVSDMDSYDHDKICYSIVKSGGDRGNMTLSCISGTKTFTEAFGSECYNFVRYDGTTNYIADINALTSTDNNISFWVDYVGTDLSTISPVQSVSNFTLKNNDRAVRMRNYNDPSPNADYVYIKEHDFSQSSVSATGITGIDSTQFISYLDMTRKDFYGSSYGNGLTNNPHDNMSNEDYYNNIFNMRDDTNNKKIMAIKASRINLNATYIPAQNRYNIGFTTSTSPEFIASYFYDEDTTASGGSEVLALIKNYSATLYTTDASGNIKNSKMYKRAWNHWFDEGIKYTDSRDGRWIIHKIPLGWTENIFPSLANTDIVALNDIYFSTYFANGILDFTISITENYNPLYWFPSIKTHDAGNGSIGIWPNPDDWYNYFNIWHSRSIYTDERMCFFIRPNMDVAITNFDFKIGGVAINDVIMRIYHVGQPDPNTNFNTVIYESYQDAVNWGNDVYTCNNNFRTHRMTNTWGSYFRYYKDNENNTCEGICP